MKKSILALIVALCFTASNADEADFIKQKEVECLAKNIYHESRGEGRIGMLAVGKVTLNRSLHPKFPDTICGTVYQKYQFSWTQTREGRVNPTQFAKAKAIALEVLSGNHELKDFPALYFHNSSVNPGWKLRKVAIIKNHHYYK